VNAYRALFAIRHVRRLALAAVLTRVGAPMLSLALLLAVRNSTGSYALGGAVLTANAVALAVVVPFTGRLVDRLGAGKVLPLCITAYILVQVSLMVALWRDAPGSVLVVLAAVLGACMPPVGPLIRSQWARVVPEERLSTAYALDAAITETAFVAGPLLVTVIVAVASPPFVLAFITFAIAVGVGVLLLGPAHAATGQPVRSGPLARRMLGALGHGPVRRILAVVVFDAASFGGVTLGVTAAAAAAGHSSIAGVLLAALAVGAGAAGLVYGSRPRRGRRRLQLTLLFAGSAVFMALAGTGPGLVVTGILMLVLGLLGGPRDTLLQLVLGDAAPENERTESFAWMGTSMWLGYGVGAGLAGRVLGDDTTAAGKAFLIAAVAGALASLLSLRLSRTAGTGAVAPSADAATGGI
jgi:MFS family permease